ncbi:universal stress protein [Pararobbsia silviterrae]|uniref:Universal stress protein n=1 Tax=Pararobbsia silviterrae TaxID=1792498 RepID=A0A494X927_9BURK|nr:universal stress protein [Pararobbsia silviterrae]RKP47068.1 universal stress protein [Pararobbsia silviterrae]
MTHDIDSTQPDGPRCRHILVAAEGGAGLRPLARCAMHLASPDAALHLIAVTGDPRMQFSSVSLQMSPWLDAHEAVLAASRTTVDGVAREVVGAGSVPTPTASVLDLSMQSDSAAQAVASVALKVGASLIAMTAFGHAERGRGIWRIDPEELAAASACPVLYVPYACLEDGRTHMKKVMVGLDGSDTAFNALSFAIARAPRDAAIHVVYVVDHAPGLRHPERIAALMKEGSRALACADAMLKEHGREAHTTMIGTSTRAHDVMESIAHEAERWGADLVVLGNRGRSPLSRWLLGSVAERMLRGARTAVLIVPAFDRRASLREAADAMEIDRDAVLETGRTLPPIFL